MKKNILLVSGIVFFVFLFLVVTSGSINSRVAGDFKYVGVSKCMTCHKSEAQGKQYDIWKSSKHSSAWTSLTTDAADKIAKDKGFSTKASEILIRMNSRILLIKKMVSSVKPATGRVLNINLFQ